MAKGKTTGQIAALHSDIALLELVNETDHLLALIELKEGLGTGNMVENLASDGNAVGQLIHVAAQARVVGALVQCNVVGFGGCGSELARGWVLSSSTPRRSRVLSLSCGILWLNHPPCQYGLTPRLAVSLGYVVSQE